MATYQFEAKISGEITAENPEAARIILRDKLFELGPSVCVFVKPKGEMYKDLYDAIFKQQGYGKWYDRE